MLEDAYRQGQEHKETVKRDVEQGRARTEQHASQAQDRMGDGTTTQQYETTRQYGTTQQYGGTQGETQQY